MSPGARKRCIWRRPHRRSPPHPSSAAIGERSHSPRRVRNGEAAAACRRRRRTTPSVIEQSFRQPHPRGRCFRRDPARTRANASTIGAHRLDHSDGDIWLTPVAGIERPLRHGSDRQRRPALTIALANRAGFAGRLLATASRRPVIWAGIRGSRRAWRTCAFCESARQHGGAGWTLAAFAFAQ